MTSTHEPGKDVAPQDGAGPRMRASDADRAATTSVLQEAVARGLLGHDEGGERMEAAFRARFTDEFPPLTADLPPAAAPSELPVAGWRTLSTALAAQVRREVAAIAAGGVRSRPFLAVVLLAVVLLGVVLALAGMAVEGMLEWGGESFMGMGAH